MTSEELKRARAIARNIISRIESEPIPAPFEERELLLARAFLHLSEAVREAEEVISCNYNFCSDSSPCDQCEWISKYGEKK